MIHWDIDRYEQLQDAAWELELSANERRSVADAQSSAINRRRARALRQEAADLLAHYWAPNVPSRR